MYKEPDPSDSYGARTHGQHSVAHSGWRRRLQHRQSSRSRKQPQHGVSFAGEGCATKDSREGSRVESKSKKDFSGLRELMKPSVSGGAPGRPGTSSVHASSTSKSDTAVTLVSYVPSMFALWFWTSQRRPRAPDRLQPDVTKPKRDLLEPVASKMRWHIHL